MTVHRGAVPPPPPPWPPISPIALVHPTTPTTETPTFNAITMNDLGEAILHVDDRDVGEIPDDIETLVQEGFRDALGTAQTTNNETEDEEEEDTHGEDEIL